jgi:hypothetical protein
MPMPHAARFLPLCALLLACGAAAGPVTTATGDAAAGAADAAADGAVNRLATVEQGCARTPQREPMTCPTAPLASRAPRVGVNVGDRVVSLETALAETVVSPRVPAEVLAMCDVTRFPLPTFCRAPMGCAGLDVVISYEYLRQSLMMVRDTGCW